MAAVEFTIFGGAGFVGARLAAHLRAEGAGVWAPGRAELAAERATGRLAERDLGHVVYAIGLTGDFRRRLRDTVDAHVSLLLELIDAGRWRSWLYLSSTRVYGGAGTGRPLREDDRLAVLPSADSVYDLSKLLGEALCLARPEPTCRVARLSNVFGSGMNPSTFLGALARDSAQGRAVEIAEDAASAKDYLVIEDAVAALARIARSGRARLYNVASGVSTEHGRIAAILREARGVEVTFRPGGLLRRFPPIDVARLTTEFGPPTRDVEAGLRQFLSRPPSSQGDRRD